MIRAAVLLAPLLLAAPAMAQSQQHYLYVCTILDGVTVAADGRLVRDADTENYARRQSPFTLDTQTGDFQRAAGVAAGITDVFHVMSHGSAMEGLVAADTNGSNAEGLHIRVDLPATGGRYRFIFHVGASQTFSGLCERKAKP